MENMSKECKGRTSESGSTGAEFGPRGSTWNV